MERLKFFLYSCANWGFGYFNAYDVGSRYDLDFWVHLGDYVRTHTAQLPPAIVLIKAHCRSVAFWVSKCCIPGSEKQVLLGEVQGNPLAELPEARHVDSSLSCVAVSDSMLNKICIPNFASNG